MSSSAFDQIQPQNCVNAKVRRLHRLLNAPYQDLIKPHGLKGSMLSILFMIGKSDVNQKTIAHSLVLDESTMSRDLKKLETMRLIERKRMEDARVSGLSLTKAGYNLLETVSPKWAALHEYISAEIGVDDLAALDSIMEKLERLKK